MWINSPRELGQLVREARTSRGLSQAELAEQLGTTRQWVIALEQGNGGAELDRVLKALFALGIRINATDTQAQPATDTVRKAISDLARDLAARTASGSVRRLTIAQETEVVRIKSRGRKKRGGDT